MHALQGRLASYSHAWVVEESCSRHWAEVTRLDCVRSEEIRKGLKQKAMVAQVKRRREGWKERVLENQGSIVKKVMRGQVEGRRPGGRPRKR